MIAQRFRFLHSAITIDAPINLQRNAALFLRTPGYRIPIGSTLISTIRTGFPSPSPFVFTSCCSFSLSHSPSPLDPSHVVAGCKSAGQVWKEKRTAGGGGQGREARTGGWVGRRGQEEEEEDEGVGIRSRTRANSSHGSRESARFRRHAWADQQITPVLYF